MIIDNMSFFLVNYVYFLNRNTLRIKTDCYDRNSFPHKRRNKTFLKKNWKSYSKKWTYAETSSKIWVKVI